MNFLGDNVAFSLWTYKDNPTMTFLLVSFTFFTGIYLMNLLIGVLNNAMEHVNRYEEFLLLKAQVFLLRKFQFIHGCLKHGLYNIYYC